LTLCHFLMNELHHFIVVLLVQWTGW
jgi:hypothetical protein